MTDRAAALAPGRDAQIRTAPERRTRETAEALGYPAEIDSRISDLDVGAWRGHELTGIPPHDLNHWLTDPGFAGHGGESVRDLIDRVRDWLDDLPRTGHRQTIAVTHPAVIRAALITVLHAPPETFRHIDVAPVSSVRLHHRGAWTLRLS